VTVADDGRGAGGGRQDDEPLDPPVALGPVEVPVPLPVVPPRSKPAGGRALLAAAMVGLQQVFEPPDKDPIAIEVHNDTGNEDTGLALHLDPEDPAASIAVVRPD
jgi:hypothetical protein